MHVLKLHCSWNFPTELRKIFYKGWHFKVGGLRENHADVSDKSFTCLAGGLSARKERGNLPLAFQIIWRLYLLSNNNIPWKGGKKVAKKKKKKVVHIDKWGHDVQVFCHMTFRIPFQPVSTCDSMVPWQ